MGHQGEGAEPGPHMHQLDLSLSLADCHFYLSLLIRVRDGPASSLTRWVASGSSLSLSSLSLSICKMTPGPLGPCPALRSLGLSGPMGLGSLCYHTPTPSARPGRWKPELGRGTSCVVAWQLRRKQGRLGCQGVRQHPLPGGAGWGPLPGPAPGGHPLFPHLSKPSLSGNPLRVQGATGLGCIYRQSMWSGSARETGASPLLADTAAATVPSSRKSAAQVYLKAWRTP